TRLRLSHQVTEEVRKYFGDKVFDTIVNRNVRISEAPSFGKPVILYDAISSGAKNYMQLASELLKRNSKNEELPSPEAVFKMNQKNNYE
ncbi:MAG TPA: hypothetical protein VLM39_02705, partial [Ignavibacteriaceae bacterium]|nr:hypothetical protein [Ignavibacteriaceae bacterium]